jgi:hypothetical protein
VLLGLEPFLELADPLDVLLCAVLLVSAALVVGKVLGDATRRVASPWPR